MPGDIRKAKTFSKQQEKEAKKKDRIFWYEFKGECYLYIIMDGEAIRERHYRGIPNRNFELRYSFGVRLHGSRNLCKPFQFRYAGL